MDRPEVSHLVDPRRPEYGGGVGAVGTVPDVDAGPTGLLRELEAVERAGWDALCTGDGARFDADLRTDDGVMVLAHGQAMGRAAVVESLPGGPAWDRYELTDLTVVPAGPDAATLVYRAAAHRTGAPPFTALMTSTYARLDDRWRLTVYTQTPRLSGAPQERGPGRRAPRAPLLPRPVSCRTGWPCAAAG